MVSVIIPCFNNAPYIRRCVESVLAQTYTDLEIIVVDDGSDDNPQQSLESISDSRLRPVIQRPHGGVSKARNAGIEAAKGEYIIFIDGDDWVEPNHVEVLMNGLKKADCSMILMQIDEPDGTINFNTVAKSVYTSSPVICRNDFNVLFESYLLSSPCNKIYRKSIIEETPSVRFNSKVSYSEDTLFNLEYFKRINSVQLCDIATYHYVKYSTSSTGRYHHNTAYTLKKLAFNGKQLVTKWTDNSDLFMMKHFLWGIINLYHKNCDLPSNAKKQELKVILNLPEFKAAKHTLKSAGVSKAMQYLLSYGNVGLINFFMTAKFKR